ncbi:TetR/AcrR family transcriptional regulator [Nonomuraea rhodomycinica]|uniref:TetR/AcrR family transcriptional regulator n=1 Tax=Nonomuraea rhodomycinica TaxID=1712872 RepID=A0A7Y6ISJ3_9ACTN|nr:TetR/AcrR family transcriptional regulator [Nonomuraea rhodomycinica]NUW43627.1 TetR/AcrR family transcriptional regulator [Nonomuraea rhodomycinica]
MTDAADAKRDQVVAAALEVFGRYGFRRTSMDLIARAARMSRPAVYLHFSGKEDVFRAVAQRFAGDIVAAAERARRSRRPITDRLYDVLAVKVEFFVGTVEAEYRAELFAEAEVLVEDVMVAFEAGYLSVVEAVLDDAADELDLLGVDLPAGDVAAVLMDAVAGIARQKADPAVLYLRLRQLVELAVRGLTSKPAGLSTA